MKHSLLPRNTLMATKSTFLARLTGTMMATILSCMDSNALGAFWEMLREETDDRLLLSSPTKKASLVILVILLT
jgi:hypothetical protein